MGGENVGGCVSKRRWSSGVSKLCMKSNHQKCTGCDKRRKLFVARIPAPRDRGYFIVEHYCMECYRRIIGKIPTERDVLE